MCGIAGFIDDHYTNEAATDVIERMCRVIRHRGPDDQGVWAASGAALGMRRLSIIDLAGGHQPIRNEDGSILIVFNGEIYNYRELQADLKRRGHHFATDCDTEVIIHAYEEFGDDCVMHLRGMFAFAIWDSKRKRLLAARDRFGKKPLNYYWNGERFVFGSEVKSILEADIPREVNPAALDAYLCFGYIPSPITIFKDVLKVPPGHILVWEDGHVRTERYWHLSFEPTSRDDEETALDRIRTLMRDAVKVRLMSDVPLGAFLSGGIDSSIVVGLMSEVMTHRVKTFSIGFEDESENELPYARRVARHFATDHHEFIVKPELIEVLPQLVWAYDEPFADPSMLPTFYVSKLARSHVTVALSGDGGDEIFAGYKSYQRELMVKSIPPPLRHLGTVAASLMPDGMRGKRRLEGLALELGERVVGVNAVVPFSMRPSLYTPAFWSLVQDLDPRKPKLDLFNETGQLETVARMQHADSHLYVTDDIMVKVDKASMLNSLETRTPLLDQHLVSYVASLPSSLRLKNNTLKYLLKRIAADMLPPDVLQRRKHGFDFPVERWFRGDLAGYSREMLTSTKARQRGIFRTDEVESLLRLHQQSRVAKAGQQIWALLCLELWFQTYMDSDGTHTPASCAASVHAGETP